jgi:2-hydroxychromene-2-carboxylate isomerase
VPGVLYYDLASPYAYLAVSRAAEVLGEAPRLQPVLVGAIFGWRGRGSWALTDQRDAGEAEIERRAAAYGLPPLVWPSGWPLNSLGPMRAAIHAERQGAGEAFARSRPTSRSRPPPAPSPWRCGSSPASASRCSWPSWRSSASPPP